MALPRDTKRNSCRWLMTASSRSSSTKSFTAVPKAEKVCSHARRALYSSSRRLQSESKFPLQKLELDEVIKQSSIKIRRKLPSRVRELRVQIALICELYVPISEIAHLINSDEIDFNLMLLRMLKYAQRQAFSFALQNLIYINVNPVSAAIQELYISMSICQLSTHSD